MDFSIIALYMASYSLRLVAFFRVHQVSGHILQWRIQNFPYLMEGAPTPNAATFHKICMSKRTYQDPWSARQVRPLDPPVYCELRL